MAININKCKFTPAQILDAKRYGVKVEGEHTTSKKKAYKIALQHECEFAKSKKLYYRDGLLPMEKRLRKAK